MENLKYNNPNELAVKVIYGDFFDLSVRMLNAKTEDTDDILELANAIELVGSCNGFVGRDVADTLRKLDEKNLITIANFGREMSPVLYVCPSVSRDYTPEERAEAFEKVMSELRETHPDELWLTDGTLKPNPCELSDAFFVRAWWD